MQIARRSFMAGIAATVAAAFVPVAAKAKEYIPIEDEDIRYFQKKLFAALKIPTADIYLDDVYQEPGVDYELGSGASRI